MSSAAPEVETNVAFPPTTPVSVRSKSIHPVPTPTPPRPVSQSPHAQHNSPSQHWPQDNLPQPSSVPSFPLDPALGGPDAYAVRDHSVDLASPESGFIPMSSSAPSMPIAPPQFHETAPQPVHLLSQYGMPNGMRMDPRAMQRTHSGASPSPFRAPGSQFLYYHQVPGLDQQPIAWSTREVAVRSPPAPRQRSAKACKKCRKRKTKCSGGLPCARCVARGLECEYDEKSTLRGPIKARIETRNIPPPLTKAETAPEASRTTSRNDQRHQPYPVRSPTRPSSAPTMEHRSMTDGMAHIPQQPPYMLHLLGMTPSGPDVGYPTYGVPPAHGRVYPHHGMEMSSMVDHSSGHISGVPIPMMSQASGSATSDWSHLVRGTEGESSDGSRPASACSGSSFYSSEGFHLDPARSGVVWPSSVPNHFGGPPIPPSLSSPTSSTSSSSLKDALVEVPRYRRTSMPEPMSGPMLGSPPHHEFATTLSTILRNAHLAEAGGAPALTASPDSWSSSLPSPVTPHSPPELELQFDDVFNLSPSVSQENQPPTWDVTPQNTVRASKSDPDNVFGLNTPSTDLKTPRAMQIFRFDFDTTGSPLVNTAPLDSA